MLLQIVRQGDPQKMLALVEKIASQGGARASRSARKREKPKAGRPKAFVFTFRPPSKAFNLRLSFNKKNASKDEIIAALENIIQELNEVAPSRSGTGGRCGLSADLAARRRSVILAVV